MKVLKLVFVALCCLVLCANAIIYIPEATCPTFEQRQRAEQLVTASFNDFTVITTTDHPCGPGNWTRVVYLDVSDPAQECPPGTRLSPSTPIRVCGIETDFATCSSTIFGVNGVKYEHVCGRIIGYQFALTDAFATLPDQDISLDGHYVDGVSLTHGTNPRTHIWTFASARDEVGQFPFTNCLCTNTTLANLATPPPTFVGNDYFCDTGSSGSAHLDPLVFYINDPLWDGDGCGPTSDCCSLNSPPWFSKRLPAPTVDDIEMRICRDQHQTDENVHIEIVELYIR